MMQISVPVRRKSGALSKRVGYVATSVWALLRLDHREQRHRGDDRGPGGRDREGAHHSAMDPGVVGLLTATFALRVHLVAQAPLAAGLLINVTYPQSS